MTFIHHYTSPLGAITMASDGDAITGLWFDGQRFFAANAQPPLIEQQQLACFEQACRWLDIYFSGKEPHFTPPLHTGGSTFQEAVWKQLLAIPYGHTTTYGEIARRIAKEIYINGNNVKRVSAQAVGGAVAHNNISLIIPCHRVIGTNGKLTGYAAGVDRKQWLLQLESASRQDTKGQVGTFNREV